jgi:hypothetical protein
MNKRRAGFWLILLAALVVKGGPIKAQEDTFEWAQRMDQGQTLEVKGIVGEIEAVYTSGNQAEVVAVKRGDDEDFHQVAIEVADAGDRIVICAVYGTWNHGQGRCHPDHRDRGDRGEREGHDEDMNVSVDYTIRLPAGIEFEGVVVSGDIRAEGLRSDVVLTTVDGSIAVSTTGMAYAKTVSGDMEIEMGDLGTGDLKFNTVSGDITLRLPADLKADVDFNSLSGDFETDFDMNITKKRDRWVGLSIEGTIGGGGRDLSLNTVSGDVKLQRQR